MGEIRQQAFKNSLVLYLGLFLGYINVVVLFPKVFSPDEFGLTRLILAFSNVLSIASNLGFKNVTVRYLPYFKDKKRQHSGFLLLVFLVPLFGFFILGGILLGFSPTIKETFYSDSTLFIQKFYFLFPIALFLLLFQALFAYSKALFASTFPVFLKEIVLRLFIMAAIILTYYQLINFDQFIIIFSLAYAIPFLGLVGYLSFKGEIFYNLTFPGVSWRYFLNMMEYGFFTLANQATAVLNRRVDVIMIGALLSSASVAIYTIAFYLANVITIPQKGLAHIGGPFIADAFANNNLERINEVYKRSSLNQFLFGSLIFIIIWINIEEILSFVGEEYLEGVYVVFFIGLSRLLSVGMGTNQQILVHSKYFRYNFLFISSLLVLVVIFNLIFIPIYGVVGAALGTAIAIVINNLMKSGLLWVKYRLSPFSKNHLLVALIVGITLILGFILPDFDWFGWTDKYSGLVNTIYKSIVLAIFYGILILTLKPSEDIHEILIKLRKRFFQ